MRYGLFGVAAYILWWLALLFLALYLLVKIWPVALTVLVLVVVLLVWRRRRKRVQR